VKARIALSVLASTLAIGSPARAADRDPWFGKDKALHFGVSAGIAATSYTAGAIVFDARGHALLAAGGFTLAVGAGKELLDLAGYGDPSWKDFVADVAGTIAGLAVAWSVDLLVRGVSDSQPLFRLPSHSSTTAAVSSPFVLTW
jgi:putative lipoprotein